MDLVFMGSPAEACEVLKIILTRQELWGVRLVAVISQPARPAGRKKVLKDPPVAEFAKAHGIRTLQPEKARDPAFLEQLRQLSPDVIVTAAYGQILSEAFLQIPQRATINIHPSLLPKYRGATPVPSALINGDTQSGVTVLFTVKALDAGNIIAQQPVDFGSTKTAGELMPELFQLGGEMLEETFRKLRNPEFVGEPQDESMVSHCGKFTKQDGLVDWAADADAILHRFRAFTPWPGVFTFYNGVRVKLLDMGPAKYEGSLAASHFQLVDNRLLVGTGDGCIEVKRLMRAGSKESDGRSFINGLRSGASSSFSSSEGKSS